MKADHAAPHGQCGDDDERPDKERQMSMTATLGVSRPAFHMKLDHPERIDTHLRHTVRWLNDNPRVRSISMGKFQHGPVRGHYPGQLKVQSDTDSGLWCKGYTPDGVRHLYVHIAPEDRDTVREQVTRLFPPHKQVTRPLKAKLGDFWFTDEPDDPPTEAPRMELAADDPTPSTTIEPTSEPTPAPPTVSENEDDNMRGTWIESTEARTRLGYASPSSVANMVKAGKLRGRKQPHPKRPWMNQLLVLESDVEKLKKELPPPGVGTGARGMPRGRKKKTTTTEVAPTPTPVPQAAPAARTNGHELAATPGMGGLALLATLVREIRAMRDDLNTSLTALITQTAQNTSENAALRDLVLSDRTSLSELLK